MSNEAPRRERPMSPFMIGPYYKPQLTSMLSITHRGTGVFLTFGAFLLAAWLIGLANGKEAYDCVATCMAHPVGKLIVIGLVFSLVFHWLNGLRHLGWDVGWGFEIPKTYATGWAVLVLSIVGTAGVLFLAFGGHP